MMALEREVKGQSRLPLLTPAFSFVSWMCVGNNAGVKKANPFCLRPRLGSRKAKNAQARGDQVACVA